MLNRKESKASNGAEHHGRGGQTPSPIKGRPRRRFIISAKAAGRNDASAHQPHNGAAKPGTPVGKTLPGGKAPVPGSPPSPVDLAETIKTLLHLAHENGHVTYDAINDVLPDAL